MPDLMSAEKVRLAVDVDEEIRQALRVEAAKSGQDMSDIVNDLLRENLAESLAEVRDRRQKQGDKKRGRT